MALKSKIALSFLVGLTSFGYSALEYEKKKELPEMATKQAVNNLRFISKDGKFTYYQRRSGSLLLSTNYKVQEVLKGELGTQYLVYSTQHRNSLIITQDENYHNFFALRKPLKIFISKFGSLKPTFISTGLSPKLHMNDSWLSWFNPQAKVLNFVSLRNTALNFKIRIGNNKNPYFIPEVVMTTDNLIYYTDLNKKGVPGLIEYNRKSNKVKAVLKGSTPSEKIELCLFNDQLYIGEFGLNNNRGSTITSASRRNIDAGKRRIIYESPLNDIGNMICNVVEKSVFFIKNTTSEEDKVLSYEAARLNTDSKEIKKLSNVKYATQIVNMDGRLILPYREKFYVLLGEHNLASIDQLEKKGTKK